MLVLDNNLLSDYLDGKQAARSFLQEFEAEPWAVSGIGLYEAYMGSVHGYIDGDVATIRDAVTASMDVLPVTNQTAMEAADLQEQLLDRGVPADHPDTLIAASAREHGGRFATAENHFWKDSVRDVIDVVEYDPY
ncbi:PIN domain-containing protein [Halomicrobium sp. LC1Hm]|uniref:PIN domain-containing protein n=1 Tax=Halomicrobium sp. LC1Hm TaxID=2610902 RepID=UPI001298546A|nr:PIN domain-containing protein [Halomicrobium sp. LC1Hm]QGA81080.1 PIN domain containing protein [Halomicrobium sp. LC1Hm]